LHADYIMIKNQNQIQIENWDKFLITGQSID